MARSLDLHKLLQIVAESKVINLDLPVSQYVNAGLIGAASYEERQDG